MSWKAFAPKLPLAVCLIIGILAIVAVMHQGVVISQGTRAGNMITVNPLNAAAAAFVMVLIGIQAFVRRHRRT